MTIQFMIVTIYCFVIAMFAAMGFSFNVQSVGTVEQIVSNVTYGYVYVLVYEKDLFVLPYFPFVQSLDMDFPLLLGCLPRHILDD